MAVQIDEKTEVTVPLKTLISVITVVVMASWYVSATQNKIADLEHTVKLADERFVSYIKQPSRSQNEIDVIKKELEYIQKEINEIRKAK